MCCKIIKFVDCSLWGDGSAVMETSTRANVSMVTQLLFCLTVRMFQSKQLRVTDVFHLIFFVENDYVFNK